MQTTSAPDNDLDSIRKRANLNKSVEISRRQFECGEYFDHAAVMGDVHAELKALSAPAPIPNAETIAALEEGDRLANDPARHPARQGADSGRAASYQPSWQGDIDDVAAPPQERAQAQLIRVKPLLIPSRDL